MLRRGLKRVIHGVSEVIKIRVASKIVAERSPRTVDDDAGLRGVDAVLAEWPADGRSGSYLAGLADAEAKRRVARIRGKKRDQAVAFAPYVTHGKYRVGAGLPFERQEVILRVRRPVLVIISDGAAHRRKLRPVDAVGYYYKN